MAITPQFALLLNSFNKPTASSNSIDVSYSAITNIQANVTLTLTTEWTALTFHWVASIGDPLQLFYISISSPTQPFSNVTFNSASPNIAYRFTTTHVRIRPIITGLVYSENTATAYNAEAEINFQSSDPNGITPVSYSANNPFYDNYTKI